MFLMIAKDCTETRLSGVALSIGVINALRVKWPERVFFSDTPRHRNALARLTEIAWEDAEQGLGRAMSTLA